MTTPRDDLPSDAPASRAPPTIVDGVVTPVQDDDAPLAAGQTFAGRYHVQRRVGIGGMGAVYQAFDTVLAESVAIKLIRPAILTDPAVAAEIERRFKRELLLGRRVLHPSVVRVHDIGEAQGLRYLTMSFVAGRDLAAVLDNDGALNPERVIRIGRRLGAALVAVHAAGVIHRDLKPANVMLGRGDQVWLTDFGIARLATDAHDSDTVTAVSGSARVGTLTTLGARVGTPEYMAPEQAGGARVDERTDVYALGLLLYDLVTASARRARYATAEAELEARRLAAPRVRVLAPDVPEVLDEVLARALDPDPAKRFQTAAAIVDALSRIENGVDPASEVSRPGEPPRIDPGASRALSPSSDGPRRPPQRRRAALVAGAVVLMIAAGAAVFATRSGLDAASEPGATDVPAAAQTSPAAPLRSVAVLPFTDLSEKKDQEYFAEGLAEELLNELSQVPELRVPGRRSSFHFKGKDASVAEIGRQLGVAHVLEGSVRKAGDRLRVTASLVRAHDGVQVWTRTFERTLTDTFTVQDEIARAVVSALAATLPRDATRFRTANPEAYDSYLRARQFEVEGTPDSDRRALELYRRAVQLDPTYVPALAAMSRMMVNVAALTNDAEGYRQALAAAERAIQLAPEFGGGYLARANVLSTTQQDWTATRRDIERTLALDPGNPGAHNEFGSLMWALGRPDEAIAAFERALAIDPLRHATWSNLGYVQAAVGRFDEARAALRRCLEISPKWILANVSMGSIELLQGRPTVALEWFGRVEDEAFRLQGTALAEHARGNAAASERALRELIAKNSGDAAYQIAGVYAWRGDADRAFEWLERARVQRDGGLGDLFLSAWLRPLHPDPRWNAFIAKIGLPIPETQARR